MVNFSDRLQESIDIKNNPTVMGLDPQFENIPACIVSEAKKISSNEDQFLYHVLYNFNVKLIDAVSDIIPAVKPQFAYYEQYGLMGLKALENTLKYAAEAGMVVIGDGKRNDIGATATSYSNAYLGHTVIEENNKKFWETDALTVNPYLGIDGILPFVNDCKKFGTGIFVLVKTSNPSASDIQDLIIKDTNEPLYMSVAKLVHEWGETVMGSQYGFSSIGAVVGATYPQQAIEIRKIMPKSFLLVPGYGAQGGKAIDCAVNFDKNGRGAIVNASRSLIYAYKKSSIHSDVNFQKATRDEALLMRDELNQAIKVVR